MLRAYNGEPEPKMFVLLLTSIVFGAARVDLLESTEDCLELLFGDADTSVRDRDRDPDLLLEPSQCRRRFLLCVDRRYPPVDGYPPFIRMLDGVRYQVANHLADASAVSHHCRRYVEIVGDCELEPFAFRFSAMDADGVVDGVGQGEWITRK